MKTIKNLKAEEIRKSILQLAIQGKLVKQDPNDEPASELVKRIYEEKKKLIAEGKIKKDKNESYIFKGEDNCYYEKIGKNEPIKLVDLPFDIPDNWMWLRMSNFVTLISGTSYDKRDVTNNGLRVLRGGNIQSFNVQLDDDDVYLPNKYIDSSRLVKKHDILIVASTGSKEVIGKPAFVNEEYENTTIGAFLRIIRPYSDNSFGYLKIIFESDYYRKIIRDSVKGTNINNLKMDTVLNIYVPLPPLKEQCSISKKLDDIKVLINEYDKYEKQLTELESTFTEKLKKSILQYAIDGKLVKQDPNDEPASVLLERIKAEKEKLIKEGKIKRDKNESCIYQGDDKNYYENLPCNWAVAKLNNICTKIVDGNHNPPMGLNNKTDYMMLSSQNINEDDINLDKVRYLSKEQFIIENKRTNIQKNDVLFTSVGSIGRSCVYNHDYNICFQRSVSIITTLICPEYLKYYFDAPKQQQIFINDATGTAQKGYYLNQLSNLYIVIPPKKEQLRIIKSIKNLFDQI